MPSVSSEDMQALVRSLRDDHYLSLGAQAAVL
jgi:hypothetical protein